VRVPILTLLLVTALAGCSGAPPHKAAPEPVVRLSATLVSPTDIRLDWKGQDPRAAGRVVEFATEPRGRYTILRFLPPYQTTFTHPDLIPRTPFYYRLRPVYGPATRPVEIILPAGPTREKGEDFGWVTPRKASGGPASKLSIRDPGAAPTDLKATVMDANGIKFTWTDHADDEEGYLLEMEPAGSPDFHVAAVLDPDVDSFGLITLPDEKHAFFRVRAFYYGKPSNLAHQTTGADRG
jgi:hypothetical protein